MRRKKLGRLLGVIALSTSLLLTACQEGAKPPREGETSQEPPLEEAGEEKKPQEDQPEKSLDEEGKNLEDQAQVEGALPGSAPSNYVEDREAWKEFPGLEEAKAVRHPIFGLHFPRILLDSKDAEKSNEEIGEVVGWLKRVYEKRGIKEWMAADPVVSSNFSVFQDGKVLSVHLDAVDNGKGGEDRQYNYNFAMEDGRRLTDKDLIKLLGLEEDQVQGVIEDNIRSAYEEQDKLDQAVEGDPSPYVYGVGYLAGFSLEEVWDNYSLDGSRLYLDKSGKLTFLSKAYSPGASPGGDGYSWDPLLLQGRTLGRGGDLAAPYQEMARLLDLDPEDEEDSQAILVYLGSGEGEKALKTTLSKLHPFQTFFFDDSSLQVLLSLVQDPETTKALRTGKDYYLLVPKYKNAVVSLQEAGENKEGKLEIKENNLMDEKKAVGPVLLGIKQEKGRAKAQVSLRFRDQELTFSPMLDEKNQLSDLPKGLVDGGPLLDQSEEFSLDFVDDSILEKILEIPFQK